MTTLLTVTDIGTVPPTTESILTTVPETVRTTDETDEITTAKPITTKLPFTTRTPSTPIATIPVIIS